MFTRVTVVARVGVGVGIHTKMGFSIVVDKWVTIGDNYSFIIQKDFTKTKEEVVGRFEN